MGGASRACRARSVGTGARIAVLALWSCASSPLVETDDGFRHARHGFRIGLPPHVAAGVVAAAPPAPDPGWERVEVEGSLLGYRRPGPIRMTLSSRCGLPLTRPEVLARHLRIGIPAHTLRHGSEVAAGGVAGWAQVFDAASDGALVRLKTVTFVADPCVLDFALSAREGRGFESAERDFDAWWRTLRLDPVRAPAGAARGPAAGGEGP